MKPIVSSLMKSVKSLWERKKTKISFRNERETLLQMLQTLAITT